MHKHVGIYTETEDTPKPLFKYLVVPLDQEARSPAIKIWFKIILNDFCRVSTGRTSVPTLEWTV